MEHREFKIGAEFWMSGKKWRCTDVGSRVIIAIWIGEYDWLECPEETASWYSGPPYGVVERVLDEYDLPACAINREESNG